MWKYTTTVTTITTSGGRGQHHGYIIIIFSSDTLMTRRFAVGILVAAIVAWPRTGLAEGSVEQGRQLGFTCLGCHGIEGQRNAYPSYRVPKLGGQSRSYVETALKAYREGSRPHPTMQAHASSLMDTDIEDILSWLDLNEPVKDSATAEMVAGSAAAAVCVTCHGPDGEGVAPKPPTLAGQHSDYLQHALHQYKDGTRGGNVMTVFAANVSDADIEAIADFYASMDGLETLE